MRLGQGHLAGVYARLAPLATADWWQKRGVAILLAVCIIVVAYLMGGHWRYVIDDVGFKTNVVPHTSNDRPVAINAKLFLPTAVKAPYSVVVILPSSSGVQAAREIYYARKLSEVGIAALVVFSYQARGIEGSLYDQSKLDSWNIENDAIAALRYLSRDKRFRPDKIAVMGVSKGGTAAMDSALIVRRGWMNLRATDPKFATHIAISPDCGWLTRSTQTTGQPILFMLAELDDQTPAAPCQAQAQRLRNAGNPNVAVILYRGVHHAWEELGHKAEFDEDIENYAQCRVWVEDNGSMRNAVDGKEIPEDGWHAWAIENCVTYGGHCCGGSKRQKERATRDIITHLRARGF